MGIDSRFRRFAAPKASPHAASHYAFNGNLTRIMTLFAYGADPRHHGFWAAAIDGAISREFMVYEDIGNKTTLVI